MKTRNVHHRHPRSRAQSYSGKIYHNENKSSVRIEDHVAYHRLFSNMLPDEMASMLNDTWISPDWKLVAVKVR